MNYPFGQYETENLKAASGRPFDELTLDHLDELKVEDISVHAETLRAQASVAQAAGFPQLAANLLRAAELTTVPRDELLQIYTLLRPGRASHERLIRLAEWLESQYQAVENARFVREAAEAYQQRGLLQREG